MTKLGKKLLMVTLICCSVKMVVSSENDNVYDHHAQRWVKKEQIVTNDFTGSFEDDCNRQKGDDTRAELRALEKVGACNERFNDALKERSERLKTSIDDCHSNLLKVINKTCNGDKKVEFENLVRKVINRY